ncbi:MAG TPA: MFS transporter, partial [Ignisphaera sp.]|nr:MFS transporter [Ignisphaera sp.]
MSERVQKYMVIPAAMYFGAAVYNVALPLLIVDLGGNVVDYAILNIVYNTLYALSSWTLPSVFKGFSRKSMLITSYGFLALIALLTAYARSVLYLVLLQIPYALAIAFATVIQTNVFVELWKGRRGITVLYIATSIGWIVSLSMSSILRKYVDTFTLLYLSVIGFASAAIASAYLPQIIGVIEAQRVLSLRAMYRWVIERARMLNIFVTPRPSLRLGKVSALKLFLLAVGITYIAIGAFFTSMPIYLKKLYRVSDSTIFALTATAGATSFILYFLQLRISEKVEVVWKTHIVALSIRTAIFLT